MSRLVPLFRPTVIQHIASTATNAGHRVAIMNADGTKVVTLQTNVATSHPS